MKREEKQILEKMEREEKVRQGKEDGREINQEGEQGRKEGEMMKRKETR